MARVLKLYSENYIGDNVDLSLLAAEDAGLRIQKWLPKSATPIYGSVPPYIVEEMDILADRSSDNDLATLFQQLNRLRHWSDMFRRDLPVQSPVFLHAKMDSETGERRAYVRNISTEWRSDPQEPAGYANDHAAALRAQIERHPYWESTAVHSLGAAASASGAAIRFQYLNSVVTKGDVPGRINRISFYAATETPVIDRLWCGIRTRRRHYEWASTPPVRYPYIWELEQSGTVGTDTALATDATASPGGGGNTKLECNFATTPGWAKRATILCSNLTAFNCEVNSIATTALWLLRHKVDSATTCRVQLRFGWNSIDDDTYIRGPVVELTNTNWDYVECGVMPMPVGELHNHGFTIGFLGGLTHQFTVQIWATRTAGSGSLHLDCLCPIPTDEGWFKASNIGGLGSFDGLHYFQGPDERDMAMVGNPPTVHQVPEWDAWNFRVPPSDSFEVMTPSIALYVVVARATSAVFTDVVQINQFDYYPRWLDLRGSQ